MRVLHVTVWPGPPFSGANVNCYNFLKRLARQHRARFIVIVGDDAAEEMTGAELAGMGIPNEGITVIRHPPARWPDILQGFAFSNLPPFMAFLERKIGASLRQEIESIREDWKPHVLMVWWSGFASMTSEISGIPKVLYAMDSISLSSLNSARNVSQLSRKVYYYAVTPRNRRCEFSVFSRFQEVIFISGRDAQYAHVHPSVRVSAIENGVDSTQLFPCNTEAEDARRPVVVFHGNLAFVPNADCADYFISGLGPVLVRTLGENGFEIRILGGGADRRLEAAAAKHRWVKLQGYVDNLRDGLCCGTVYAAPVTMGAGMKNKVLDAMACGLPVVGTEEAFSGMTVRTGVHCVCSPRERMAEEILNLIRDPVRRKSLGQAAREWIVKNADWDVLADRFGSVIRRASGV